VTELANLLDQSVQEYSKKYNRVFNHGYAR
jgi:hypothetical protein